MAGRVAYSGRGTVNDALSLAVIPVLDYGELFAHTLLTLALFYSVVVGYRRLREALRREALAARIAELRGDACAHSDTRLTHDPCATAADRLHPPTTNPETTPNADR